MNIPNNDYILVDVIREERWSVDSAYRGPSIEDCCPQPVVFERIWWAQHVPSPGIGFRVCDDPVTHKAIWTLPGFRCSLCKSVFFGTEFDHLRHKCTGFRA